MYIFLESFLLALSVCIDSFFVSMSYGASKIKIPFFITILMNFISASILGFSFFLGDLIKTYIPKNDLPIIAFFLLFGMGIIRLGDSFIKSFIRKHGKINNQISFSFFNFQFILYIYSQPCKADIDASKTLSLKEALPLSIALSLDGMLIGMGAALNNVSYFLTLFITFLLGILCLILGQYLGEKILKKTKKDFSFVSGLFLIVLSFMKL